MKTFRSVAALAIMLLTGCSGWAYTNTTVSAGHSDLGAVHGLDNTSLFISGTWSRVPLPVTVVDEKMRQIVREQQEAAWGKDK